MIKIKLLSFVSASLRVEVKVRHEPHRNCPLLSGSRSPETSAYYSTPVAQPLDKKGHHLRDFLDYLRPPRRLGGGRQAFGSFLFLLPWCRIRGQPVAIAWDGAIDFCGSEKIANGTAVEIVVADWKIYA